MSDKCKLCGYQDDDGGADVGALARMSPLAMMAAPTLTRNASQTNANQTLRQKVRSDLISLYRRSETPVGGIPSGSGRVHLYDDFAAGIVETILKYTSGRIPISLVAGEVMNWMRNTGFGRPPLESTVNMVVGTIDRYQSKQVASAAQSQAVGLPRLRLR